MVRAPDDDGQGSGPTQSIGSGTRAIGQSPATRARCAAKEDGKCSLGGGRSPVPMRLRDCPRRMALGVLHVHASLSDTIGHFS